METCHTTEAEKMARTWFSEIPSSCSLTLLLGPAWVLLKYVLQAIFSGPVESTMLTTRPQSGHREGVDRGGRI